MAVADLRIDFLTWVAALALARPPRLAPLLRGALFAKGRRTVASRPRRRLPAYYHFPSALGRCGRAVPGPLLRLAAGHAGGGRLLSAPGGRSAPRTARRRRAPAPTATPRPDRPNRRANIGVITRC
jgi:hypothetical protein